MGTAFASHPRIFVVDDEIDIAKMLSVVLQMHLFDAMPFADPAEALEAASSHPPDYLISDIGMQGMSGIELAFALHRQIPECKILLFSGLADAAELVQRAVDEGMTLAFLAKPVHPTELVAVLRNL